MKWAKRRERSVETGTPDPAAGLDARAWAVVCESATAAHHGDAGAHIAPLLRYEQEAPLDMMAGAYLRYLLRCRVAELVGGRPGVEDLQALAGRHYPAFSRLIRGAERQLADTLLTVFDLPHTTGRCPEAELTAMRPHLAAWWARNAASFQN